MSDKTNIIIQRSNISIILMHSLTVYAPLINKTGQIIILYFIPQTLIKPGYSCSSSGKGSRNLDTGSDFQTSSDASAVEAKLSESVSMTSSHAPPSEESVKSIKNKLGWSVLLYQ